MKLGIVTGKGSNSAEISIAQLQLAPFFPVVITGDDVAEPKPHPEGILLAMKLLQAEPQTTLYVGDSDSDIKAAKAAGVTSVGVN
ncbi:HAD family hydrolase, partial [Frankia sp. Mgl5]|uniref:HAD family hydrolase n=1 Tax=Frankia sp. Mgl5 TaxID=2933793 RepID=UPI0020352B0A